jgi:hypothetical protein
MKRQSFSMRHETVYHAASCCQGKRSGLTAARLRGLKKACLIARQQTGGCFASDAQGSGVGRSLSWLGDAGSLTVLGCHKGGSLRGFLLDPHREQDSHPDLGQSSDGQTVALALAAFAVGVVLRPPLLLSTLPGKLMPGVAQRLEASQAWMDAGRGAAFKRHRRSPGQGLNTACSGRALAILSPLSQQAGSQSLASAGQRSEDLVVFRRQKKRGDLLIVGRDLLQQWQQLSDQRQHQARLRAKRDGISHQMRWLPRLVDLWGTQLRAGMPSLPERLRQLLERGGRSAPRGGIGLQKDQGGLWLELGEQLQSRRIRRLQAGGQLLDQARLQRDQRVLIAGQGGSSFGHLGTIRVPSSQVGHLAAAMLGQHVRINQIGLGSRGRAFAINGFWVDRIEAHSRLPQGGNEQTMRGFDQTGDLIERGKFTHKVYQLRHPFRGRFNPKLGDFAARFVDHDGVMIG